MPRLVRASEVYLSSSIFALVIVLSMSALGMYQHRSREDIRNTLLRILPSFALGFAVLSVLIRFIPSLHFGRGSVLIFGLGAIGVLLARLVVFKSSQSALMKGRLILVGGGVLARECMDLAASKIGFHQFTVVGCGFAVLSVLIRFVPSLHFGRGSVLIFGLGAIGVLLARLVVFKSSQSALMEGRLILVGGGALARECMDLAASKIGFHQFTVVGCIDVAGEQCCVPASALLPAEPSLLAMAQRHAAHEIVVSVSDRRNGAFPAKHAAAY